MLIGRIELVHVRSSDIRNLQARGLSLRKQGRSRTLNADAPAVRGAIKRYCFTGRGIPQNEVFGCGSESAEAAERLHVANAVAELRRLEHELEEVRAERDQLRGEAGKLGPRRPAPAAPRDAASRAVPTAEEQAARAELVAMIERLADDMASAVGAEPLPPVSAPRDVTAAQPAAAE